MKQKKETAAGPGREERSRRRKLLRIIWHRAAGYTGAGLVVSALIRGVAGALTAGRLPVGSVGSPAGAPAAIGADAAAAGTAAAGTAAAAGIPYFTWAMCAAGTLLIAWGWFTYLAASGSPILKRRRRSGRREVPYILQREHRRRHRPAFARGNEDFDDDLTAAVAVDEEDLDEKERDKVLIGSRCLAGLLLLALSWIPV